jgi:hypothetical protein
LEVGEKATPRGHLWRPIQSDKDKSGDNHPKDEDLSLGIPERMGTRSSVNPDALLVFRTRPLVEQPCSWC